MTSNEKVKIAELLDKTYDFLSSGYRVTKKEYNFDDNALPENNTQNIDSLEKIAAEIKECKDCKLCLARKNTVPGEGVTQPLVMVIGEGPGADEDKTGRPFVGKAGQLLDKMLESINLSRKSNCFIANIVKCRPPDNRDPYPEEAAACLKYLKRQIAILNPKIILLVGNTASQNLLDIKASVGKIRGKFMEYNTDNTSIPLLITYHPSALLHNTDYKRPAWEDLKLLRSKIESL